MKGNKTGLYFKYGTVNSSKTAQLLMARFNYEQEGFRVLLIKPALDTRDECIRSRVGLEAPCMLIEPSTDGKELRRILANKCRNEDYDIIMADEAQFFTEDQIDALYDISFERVVMCFGLLTDFQRKFFPGSERLVALADSLQEIKTICNCGNKATVNGRYAPDGKLILAGSQILIGGNDVYKPLCKRCYKAEVKRALE